MIDKTSNLFFDNFHFLLREASHIVLLKLICYTFFLNLKLVHFYLILQNYQFQESHLAVQEVLPSRVFLMFFQSQIEEKDSLGVYTGFCIYLQNQLLLFPSKKEGFQRPYLNVSMSLSTRFEENFYRIQLIVPMPALHCLNHFLFQNNVNYFRHTLNLLSHGHYQPAAHALVVPVNASVSNDFQMQYESLCLIGRLPYNEITTFI